MNTVLGMSDLERVHFALYKRNVMHYANSLLNGDISFDRAVKTLQFDTGYDIVSLEQDLCYAVSLLCPLREKPESWTG